MRKNDVERQILLVDDERPLLAALSLHLEGAGYHVLIAANAETALGMLMLYRPDAIVCDVDIPGMNGFALYRKIRQNPELQAVRFFLLTDGAEQLEMEQIRNLQIDGHLHKPFEPDELIALLNGA